MPTSAGGAFYAPFASHTSKEAHSVDKRAKNKLQRTQINGRGVATDTAAAPRLFLRLQNGFFLFRLSLSGIQNKVYVSLHCVVFFDLLFEFTVVGI